MWLKIFLWKHRKNVMDMTGSRGIAHGHGPTLTWCLVCSWIVHTSCENGCLIHIIRPWYYYVYYFKYIIQALKQSKSTIMSSFSLTEREREGIGLFWILKGIYLSWMVVTGVVGGIREWCVLSAFDASCGGKTSLSPVGAFVSLR